MADETPTTETTREKIIRVAKKYGPWLVLVAIPWAMLAYRAVQDGTPLPPPPPLPQQVAPPPAEFAAATDPDAPVMTFGWVPDAPAVQAVVAAEAVPNFADTPAGKVAQGDEDVYLWRAVRQVNADKGPAWYPNVNQRDVGCCVGCGFKHSVDIVQAAQIVRGGRFSWKPVAVEAIYGGSRVEIGGGRLSGDGSVGAWAYQSVKRFGNLEMTAHGSTDLTTFSPARAREWGRRGIPDDLEPKARETVVKGGALVKSWTDVKRAIGQDYPVAVCSDQGFTMVRDRDGFARPQGSWPHCMAIVGVRTTPREGGFILNSWGDTAHTGGTFPPDMPAAGFWADASVIDRMVSQGDSYALSDLAGFPSRRSPWRVQTNPRPRIDVGTSFALAY